MFLAKEDSGKGQPAAEDLAAAFDPRLADVWLSVFDLWPQGEPIPHELGWFLRMAYLQGYGDSLGERRRGDLFRSLGLVPPSGPAPPPGRPSLRKARR